jgi:TolA-binding protein
MDSDGGLDIHITTATALALCSLVLGVSLGAGNLVWGLSTQISILSGKIEALTQLQQQLNDQQTKELADLNTRIRALEIHKP